MKTTTMMTKGRSTLILFLLLFLLIGCESEGEDGVIGTGFAQKGPFLEGSLVTITEYTEHGEPISPSTYVNTKDNLGNFDFKVIPKTLYKVEIYGDYLNEITGTVSNSRLRLSAMYYTHAPEEKIFGVNMLTLLTTDRIITFVKNGFHPSRAIDMAQKEVAKALGEIFPIDPAVNNFTDMSLFNVTNTNENANAYLLAVSSAIYKAAITESLTTDPTSIYYKIGTERSLAIMMVTLINDLNNNARFNAAIIEKYKSASRELVTPTIQNNLKALSSNVLGQELSVANMDIFLDTDADGTTNQNDSDIDGDGTDNINDSAAYDPFVQ